MDCQAQGVHTKLTEVEVGENLEFGISVVFMFLNVYIGHKSETGKWADIMTIHKENLYYHDHAYKGRTEVYRVNQTAMKIRISDICPTDGGTFFIKVEGLIETYKECNTVYVLGIPTIPTLSIIAGGSEPTSSMFTKVRCSSTSTTVPKHHSWKLVYFFKVNDTDVLPGDDSRFSVSGDTLMIAHRQDEPSIQVTCTVNEDNSHPTNVSNSITPITYEESETTAGKVTAKKGSCMKAKINFWAVVCCCILLSVGELLQ